MKRQIIALNGWPQSGKSAVAEMLRDHYGAVIVDDGSILREAAPILFRGVDLADCYSQEGKLKPVEINGKTYTVRQALGYLGQCLEDFFGEDYIPDQTVRRIAELPDAPYYVLPSVRKGQGHFYREHGAVVAEIDRNVPASENPFDVWDRTAVHKTLNNTRSLSYLGGAVTVFMDSTFGDRGITPLLNFAA
jgi:hypothetical protein